MNEGLKAAVIEAIRIFASVLVFFLLGFFRFYHGFDGETSPDDAVTFFIVGAVCVVHTYREFPSYLKNLIERMKKDGRS